MNEPFELTVAQAARRIRSRKLSSRSLAESLLDRIDRLEPDLQAWVTIDREAILDSAHQRDRELDGTGPKGPLHGIPVALKDIFYTAGMKTTACSKIYAEFVSTYDATSVARLKEAGAIVLGKAVTTEFATGDPSPTRNPWDPAHTPGGSSSGSAVSVAARMAPAATGSQTGGSVCRPASYNGIVGLKPTYGRISRYGVVPVSWSLDTVGILVRTVEDAAILLGVMAGHDAHDPASSTKPVPDYTAALDSPRDPPRIGLIRDFFLENCDDEVRRHTESVVQSLGRAGAAVEEVALPPSFATSHAAHRMVMHAECAALHEEQFRQRADDYGPRIRGNIESGMLISATQYLQAQRMRRRFREEMASLAGTMDVLLTPTTTTPAPRDLSTTGDPVFQSPWTSSGLPTITIPSGLSETGLPLGIQLAGRPFGEENLLGVARWCEMALAVELTPPDPPRNP